MNLNLSKSDRLKQIPVRFSITYMPEIVCAFLRAERLDQGAKPLINPEPFTRQACVREL
jgi:hypothetical protein